MEFRYEGKRLSWGDDPNNWIDVDPLNIDDVITHIYRQHYTLFIFTKVFTYVLGPIDLPSQNWSLKQLDTLFFAKLFSAPPSE